MNAYFDRLGAFIYSPEEGTKAAKFPGKVSRKTAEARCNKLMELSATISQERSELFIDQELEVLIEEIDAEENEAWGRSYRDAPEIDGLVCVSGIDAKNLKRGEIIRAKIFDCAENDLFGEVIE